MRSLFCVLILASASIAQTPSPVPQSADWMVNPTPFKLRLPWEITTAGVKRKHPVDKVWDRALDDLDSRCQSIKKPHSV